MPGNDVAKKTEMVLKLNRAELLEMRRTKILYIMNQFEILVRTEDLGLRDLLRRNIETNEAASEQEFAAQARSIGKSVVGKLAEAGIISKV